MDISISALEAENLEKESEEALSLMLKEDREKNWIPDSVLFLRSKRSSGPWHTFAMRGNAPEKNKKTAKDWAGHDSFLTRDNEPRLGYRVQGEVVRHKSSSPVWKVISPDNEIFDMKSIDVWPIILGPGLGPKGEIPVPLVWGQTSMGIRLIWTGSALGKLLITQPDKEKLERKKNREAAQIRREEKKENVVSLTLLSEWKLKNVGAVVYTGRREYDGKKWYSFMTTHSVFEINSKVDRDTDGNWSNWTRRESKAYADHLRMVGSAGEALYLFKEVPALGEADHDYSTYWGNDLSDPKYMRSNEDSGRHQFSTQSGWEKVRVETDRSKLLLERIEKMGSTPEEWCEFVLPNHVNLVFLSKNNLELVRSVTQDVARSRHVQGAFQNASIPHGMENYDKLSQWRQWKNVSSSKKGYSYEKEIPDISNVRSWLLGFNTFSYGEWTFSVVDETAIAEFPKFLSE